MSSIVICEGGCDIWGVPRRKSRWLTFANDNALRMSAEGLQLSTTVHNLRIVPPISRVGGIIRRA